MRIAVARDRQSVERIAGVVAADIGLEVASVRSVIQAVKDLAATRRRFLLLAELRDRGNDTEITFTAAAGSFGQEEEPLPAHLIRRLAKVPDDIAASLGRRHRSVWASGLKRIFADLPSTASVTVPVSREAAEQMVIRSFRSLPDELVDSVDGPSSELRLVGRSAERLIEYAARVRIIQTSRESATLEGSFETVPGCDASVAEKQLRVFLSAVLQGSSGEKT